MEQKVKEVITQLKSVRQEKGMSYQDIIDQCAANGDYLSMSSVRRVFSPNSEDMGFRYETTIQPIARVVLGLDETEEESKAEGHDLTEIETENYALKTMIALKNKMLEAKEQEIERLMSSTQNQVDAIKSQLETREKNIEYLKSQVTEQRRAVTILAALVIILLLLVIFALVLDKINPDMGFFWLH